MAMNFSRIKLLRRSAGLTQEELAERVGVTRQAVAKWEKGDSAPDVELCLRLGDLFGMTVDMLLRQMDETPCTSSRGMHCVRVSEKGQITLPAALREAFGIRPGDVMMLLADTDKGIALVPGGTGFPGEEAPHVRD